MNVNILIVSIVGWLGGYSFARMLEVGKKSKKKQKSKKKRRHKK